MCHVGMGTAIRVDSAAASGGVMARTAAAVTLFSHMGQVCAQSSAGNDGQLRQLDTERRKSHPWTVRSERSRPLRLSLPHPIDRAGRDTGSRTGDSIMTGFVIAAIAAGRRQRDGGMHDNGSEAAA